MTDLEKFRILDTPKAPTNDEIATTLHVLKYFELFFSDDNFSNLSICFHNTLNYIIRYHFKHL